MPVPRALAPRRGAPSRREHRLVPRELGGGQAKASSGARAGRRSAQASDGAAQWRNAPVSHTPHLSPCRRPALQAQLQACSRPRAWPWRPRVRPVSSSPLRRRTPSRRGAGAARALAEVPRHRLRRGSDDQSEEGVRLHDQCTEQAHSGPGYRRQRVDQAGSDKPRGRALRGPPAAPPRPAQGQSRLALPHRRPGLLRWLRCPHQRPPTSSAVAARSPFPAVAQPARGQGEAPPPSPAAAERPPAAPPRSPVAVDHRPRAPAPANPAQARREAGATASRLAWAFGRRRPI
jgi:hypothetical protein